MKRVYKYPLSITSGPQEVLLPACAELLYAEMDPQKQLCVWALVDAAKECWGRKFEVYATGQPIVEDVSYVGTVHDGQFVWHVMEVHGC